MEEIKITVRVAAGSKIQQYQKRWLDVSGGDKETGQFSTKKLTRGDLRKIRDECDDRLNQD